MELGMARVEDFDARRNTEVSRRKCLLLLSQAERRACCTRLPTEEEIHGKRDGSLVLTIRAKEAEDKTLHFTGICARCTTVYKSCCSGKTEK